MLKRNLITCPLYPYMQNSHSLDRAKVLANLKFWCPRSVFPICRGIPTEARGNTDRLCFCSFNSRNSDHFNSITHDQISTNIEICYIYGKRNETHITTLHLMKKERECCDTKFKMKSQTNIFIKKKDLKNFRALESY